MILTSNLTFGSWDQAFAGETVLMGAMLNRLLHHTNLVQISSGSFCLKDKRRAGVMAKREGRRAAPPGLGLAPPRASCGSDFNRQPRARRVRSQPALTPSAVRPRSGLIEVPSCSHVDPATP